MIGIGLYHFNSKIISFSIFPLTYNGKVTWLTWPQVIRVKNPRYANVSPRVFTRFRKFHLPAADEISSSCGRGLDSAAKSRHFLAVQRFTYDVIGQWPDLAWKCDRCKKIRLESRVSYAKFQLSIYNAFWAVAEKPSGRCTNPPPSAGEGQIIGMPGLRLI